MTLAKYSECKEKRLKSWQRECKEADALRCTTQENGMLLNTGRVQ